jgi:hypothetical protein
MFRQSLHPQYVYSIQPDQQDVFADLEKVYIYFKVDCPELKINQIRPVFFNYQYNGHMGAMGLVNSKATLIIVVFPEEIYYRDERKTMNKEYLEILRIPVYEILRSLIHFNRYEANRDSVIKQVIEFENDFNHYSFNLTLNDAIIHVLKSFNCKMLEQLKA